LKKLNDFNAQGLSNSMWAIAQLCEEAPEFFEALCNEGMKKLSDFNAQNLSNSMWAIAKLRKDVPEFFEALCNEGMKKLSDFNVESRRMSMGAFSKVGRRAHDFYKALFRIELHGTSLSQRLTPARSHSSPPAASPATSPRTRTISKRSSSVCGRWGSAVLEVSNVVKPQKENIYDLLRDFSPGCPVEKYVGPRSYARVGVVEEDTDSVRELIKQLGNHRGNKDVQVKRVQASTA
jgi:hypothetical protein